jgi:hypothetical protein
MTESSKISLLSIDLEAIARQQMEQSGTAHECMAIRKEWREGKITSQEMDVLIASVAYKTLSSYEPTPYPIRPQILREFDLDKLSPKWQEKRSDQKKAVIDRIFMKDSVKEYIEKYSDAVTENISNAKFLEWMIDTFKSNGLLAKARDCWRVYNQHEDNQHFKKRVWKCERHGM